MFWANYGRPWALRAASGRSWGAAGNKFHENVEYEGIGLRYDRILSSRNVWAESFLVGQRKTFFEGHEFFLSDHHAVLGFFDCHSVFSDSGRAATAMARARRAQIVGLRDLRCVSGKSSCSRMNGTSRDEKKRHVRSSMRRRRRECKSGKRNSRTC